MTSQYRNSNSVANSDDWHSESDTEMDNSSMTSDSGEEEHIEEHHGQAHHAPLQVPATLFAPPYRSTYLAELLFENKKIHKQLKHVNCNYLSTAGAAPNLTQLKQHAQSLAVLIKHLSISTHPMVIDNQDEMLPSHDGESWDWLNDLTKPYTGPKKEELVHHHNLPLTALLNVLEQVPSSENQGRYTIRDHCPLHSASHLLETTPKASSLPYATNQSLISHANALLELIDQQYSAKGGLLSILPPETEKEDRKKAESTLLGQYILYTQRLVSRLHILERQYANSLDILAGESLVPSQTLSALGPDGRRGRELTYPQDRFVLVNAGQDVWSHLDREFNRREQVDDEVRKEFLAQGVTGERLWMQRGGKEYERGITAIDVTTRYYRLINDPLKTIFIIPAWESHPGVSATIELESRPTVVSVVQPVWPERVSLWEQQNRERLAQLTALERENRDLKESVQHKGDEVTFLRLEVEKTNQTNLNLTRKLSKIENSDQQSIATEIEDLEKREIALQLRLTNAQELFEEAERMKATTLADRDSVTAEIARRRSDIEERERAAEQNILLRMRKIAEAERETQIAAEEWWEENKIATAKEIQVLNKMREALLDGSVQAHQTASDPGIPTTKVTEPPSSPKLSTSNERPSLEGLKRNAPRDAPGGSRPLSNSFRGIVGMASLQSGAANSPAGNVVGEAKRNNLQGEGRALRSYTGTPVLEVGDKMAEDVPNFEDLYDMSD